MYFWTYRIDSSTYRTDSRCSRGSILKTGVNRIDSSFPESIPALPESIPEIQNRFQNTQFVTFRFCEESNRFQLPGIDSRTHGIDSRAFGIDSRSHRIGYLSQKPQNLITFHIPSKIKHPKPQILSRTFIFFLKFHQIHHHPLFKIHISLFPKSFSTFLTE